MFMGMLGTIRDRAWEDPKVDFEELRKKASMGFGLAGERWRNDVSGDFARPPQQRLTQRIAGDVRPFIADGKRPKSIAEPIKAQRGKWDILCRFQPP